jgi:hypothetical protein
VPPYAPGIVPGPLLDLNGRIRGHIMTSFVHTCDRCGTRMQVHERYFGRTLKCTGCRTEFVAEMREEDVAPPPPAAAAPRARPGKRAARSGSCGCCCWSR